ncbi:MAG: GDP-mannose 4,6-dehydratase, partial [Spirochaetota bacterium]|uniref:GDP-mannose 4,6-dehydratase n=1 Tax=Candidatus Avelusimicrobium faecicola TaxID=3416205 RepID=UPI002A5C661B|nr:GDP-mannose 4,6-dehydratase [Spirochaetota bacterium]
MLNQPYTWVITGGAGFIGSHLAKTLVAQGQRVRIFDNFSSGRKENLAAIANQVQIIEGDICDFNALLPALKGADFVLHHAALVSVPESVQKPLATWQINVQGTANVLEAARQNRIRRVVFACSSAIYGNGPDLPYKESAPASPQSPYALSKL